MRPEEREQREMEVLRKFRELQRDLLYLRYISEWAEHLAPGQAFWGGPTDDDRKMLKAIEQYAEHGFKSAG